MQPACGSAKGFQRKYTEPTDPKLNQDNCVGPEGGAAGVEKHLGIPRHQTTSFGQISMLTFIMHLDATAAHESVATLTSPQQPVPKL